jgi:hypothetical protein
MICLCGGTSGDSVFIETADDFETANNSVCKKLISRRRWRIRCGGKYTDYRSGQPIQALTMLLFARF